MNKSYLCKKMHSNFHEDLLSFPKSGTIELNFDKTISKIAILKLIKKNDMDFNNNDESSSHQVFKINYYCLK